MLLGMSILSTAAPIGSIVDDSNENTVLGKEDDRKLRLRLTNKKENHNYSKSKVAKKAFNKRRSKYHKTKTHKHKKYHDSSSSSWSSSSSSEDLYWYKNGKHVNDGWVSLDIFLFYFCAHLVFTISMHTWLLSSLYLYLFFLYT